ncbi:neuroglobin-like isoform X1 [Mercenaria mercenaria]|uniref:neuroglobin-like isoform X1 n=1 Tax=Mercenaria mercenaria TaxID=6596 RepID=UPI001E1D7E45|nr:neuroglobin-like isoform X1 [Mercenaria mercenaria]
MGNTTTKFENLIHIKKDNNNLKTAFNPADPPPNLSEKDAELLRTVWESLKDDIHKVGVITFVNLFETHPEVQNVFMSFRTKNTSDLEYNHILRAHALRVMGTVDKCIYRLDNRDKLRDLMMDLGIRHQNYSVKIEYIDLMGPQFISSIKPHLENMWTEEHERAWENLFQLMCYYMKKGMCSI